VTESPAARRRGGSEEQSGFLRVPAPGLHEEAMRARHTTAIQFIAALLGLLLFAGMAHAVLQPQALDGVGVSLPANARLPMGLALIDENKAPRTLADVIDNRPSLLILADYACKTLCGPALALAVSSLGESGLKPGQDYRLLVIGLNTQSNAEQARAAKEAQVGQDGALAQATTFLTADQATLAQITDSLGYRYAYDAQNDQFAHPEAAFVLTAQGQVVRVLSALGLDPTDIRLALVDAGEGRAGSLVDRAVLLCYGFDPAAGIYTLSIHRVLAWLSLLSAGALAGAIGIMRCREAIGRSVQR
jgi:protein SCO1/2